MLLVEQKRIVEFRTEANIFHHLWIMDDYTQNEMHNLSCNYHWYVRMAKKKRLLLYFECTNINRTYRCTWKEGVMLGLDGIEVYIIFLFIFET